MVENDLICKILFQSAEMRTAQWILGVVDKEQLFSPINNFIEVKNYGNKVISKGDIEEVKIYKEYESVVIDKTSLAINRSILMES
jgi:hypothetical protein